jgi:hypothetical protein
MAANCGCELIDETSPETNLLTPELASILLQYALDCAPRPDAGIGFIPRPDDIHRSVLCPHLQPENPDFDPSKAVRCSFHHDCARRRRWLDTWLHLSSQTTLKAMLV